MKDIYPTETVSRVWSKAKFQEIRKALIAQGFPIKKTEDGNGYELKLKNEQLLLKAMKGQHGYLVRHVHNLFVAA